MLHVDEVMTAATGGWFGQCLIYPNSRQGGGDGRRSLREARWTWERGEVKRGTRRRLRFYVYASK